MDDNKQEFDIEDIIREFGSGAVDPNPAEKAPEAQPQEAAAEEAVTDDTVRLDPEAVKEAAAPEATTDETPRMDPAAEADAPSESREDADDTTIRMEPMTVPEDETIRMEPVPADKADETPKSVSGDTIRIEVIPDVQGQVRDAAHIDDQDEPAPYSEEWEPKYEQPIADYVPPQTIAFKPKQRLREIKKALVEGPEQEYYRLAEKGFGRLNTAIFFCFLVVLVSALTTVLMAINGPLSGRHKFMIFVQFMALLCSALLGSFQLVDGLLTIGKGRFNLNSLLLCTFAACVADGVLCFRQQRIPCCAAFSLQVTMALWSTYQTRNARMGQLDTMRKATRLDGLFPVTHQDQVYLVRGQGEVAHFNDHDKDTPHREKVLNIYALIALLVSCGAGVLAGVLHNWNMALQVASVTALAAMPATMLVCVRRPMGVLELRMHKLGTVICGWHGAKKLTGKQLFPITHEDLFPAGTVKLNGVKFFEHFLPDQVIACAAALATKEAGMLNSIFSQLLESRNGIRYDPKEFRFYEGGVGGVVDGQPVLLGSVELLKEMGVEIPEGIRVNHAVYVSIDGELSGLFAITYDLTRSAAQGLATLCSYKGLQPVIVSRDFMLTPAFIREHFGVNPKKILFPEMEERTALANLAPEADAEAAALITGEGLSGFAFATTGARSLRTGVNLGIVIHLIGGILGMLMMLVLAFLGRTELLTPANLFLYELVWLVPGLLITEWTRSI